MNYKVYVYALMLLFSVFAISGINFNGFFKTNKLFEAKTFVILLIMALTYLSANFVIDFISLT